MNREVQFCSIGTLKSKEKECHKAIILYTSLKDKEKILITTDLVEKMKL